MRKCGFHLLVLAVSGSVFLEGCRSVSATRIGADGSRHGASKDANAGEDAVGLKAYLAEGTTEIQTFQQFDLGSRGASSRAYERENQSRGRVEGSLIGRVGFPLGQNLDPHSRGGDRPKLAWPTAHGKRMDAFFIEFKPAILEWPAEAREGETVEALAEITAFEHDGVPFAYGTCQRTMRVAGHERVTAGEQSFDDALRMEAETELTFGWLATIHLHETAWFARGVGLVRREERFSGRALWLFRFQGTARYELAAGGGNGEKSDRSAWADNEGRVNQSQWSRLAICFERSGRRIRVSGMALEWANSTGESGWD